MPDLNPMNNQQSKNPQTGQNPQIPKDSNPSFAPKNLGASEGKKIQIQSRFAEASRDKQSQSPQFIRGEQPATQDLPAGRQGLPGGRQALPDNEAGLPAEAETASQPTDQAELPSSLEEPSKKELPEDQSPETPTEDISAGKEGEGPPAEEGGAETPAEGAPENKGAAKAAEGITGGSSPLSKLGGALKFLTGGKGKILEIFGIFISGSSLVFIILFVGVAIFLGILIAKLTFGAYTSAGNFVNTSSGKTSGYSYWENKYAGISCPPPGNIWCHPSPHCDSVRPDLVTTNFLGKNVVFHKCATADLQAVSRDIQAAGLDRRYNFLRNFGGTFCCRRNVNAPSSCSPHSYGIAIDINPDTNPNVKRGGRAVCPHDIPEEAIAIFKKHNFGWGGDFPNTCDAMHFEWRGKCP